MKKQQAVTVAHTNPIAGWTDVLLVVWTVIVAVVYFAPYLKLYLDALLYARIYEAVLFLFIVAVVRRRISPAARGG